MSVGKGRTSLQQLESGKVVHSIVAACCVQLSGNSPKSKSAVFALLKSLVTALNVSARPYPRLSPCFVHNERSACKPIEDTSSFVCVLRSHFLYPNSYLTFL